MEGASDASALPAVQLAGNVSETMEEIETEDAVPKDSHETIAPNSHLATSDRSVVSTYFQYYGKLANQMNMLQDSVRTEMYRRAILENVPDFDGKRVMDVGSGSGILSFFAAQAGASNVYAVEASSIAETLEVLCQSNSEIGKKITVINKTVESIDISTELKNEKVDVLVSEPIGTFLFNERMIETYLFARDAFLKEDGCMFPNKCRLYLAPFTDSQLYSDFCKRNSFWESRDFHGVDLSAAAPRAAQEYFRQPIVDYVDPRSILSDEWFQQDFDLMTIDRNQLKEMRFDFSFVLPKASLVHGLVSWFDVLFEGSASKVGFSTAPWCLPTHWYQIRFLFRNPLAVNAGQRVVGYLHMKANTQQSYYIQAMAQLEGTEILVETALIDLKDPDYRYYTSPQNSYVPSTPVAT